MAKNNVVVAVSTETRDRLNNLVKNLNKVKGSNEKELTAKDFIQQAVEYFERNKIDPTSDVVAAPRQDQSGTTDKALLDKLDSNLGYVYENAVAQMLTAKGNNLFYYTMESETSNHLYEIDFLTSVGDKICPIEVKSGNYRGHKSLDVFCDKFSSRVREKYVVHTKDYKWENGIHYLPVYMVPFL